MPSAATETWWRDDAYLDLDLDNIQIITVRYPPRATTFSVSPFAGATDFSLKTMQVQFDPGIVKDLVALGGTSFSLEQMKKVVATKLTKVWNANIPVMTMIVNHNS